MLPPYEAVIFDEAHQIEEVASEFFGLHVSSHRAAGAGARFGRARPPRTRCARDVAGRRLQGAADALADALRDRLPRAAPPARRVRVPFPRTCGPARAPRPLSRAGRRAGGDGAVVGLRMRRRSAASHARRPSWRRWAAAPQARARLSR